MATTPATPATPAPTKLFVGNLDASVDSGELRKLFEQYGVVAECDVLGEYGFVHFYDGLEAEAALVLNGYDFDGRSLRVEKSKSYVRRTPGQKESVSRTGCYFCGKDGHWAKDCPDIPEDEREKQRRRTETKSGGHARPRGRHPERYEAHPRDRFYDPYQPPPARDYYDYGYDDYRAPADPYRYRQPYYDDYYQDPYYPPPRRGYSRYDDYPPPRAPRGRPYPSPYARDPYERAYRSRRY